MATILSLLTTLGNDMASSGQIMFDTTPPPDFTHVTNVTSSPSSSSIQSAFVYSIPEANLSLAGITGTYRYPDLVTAPTTVVQRRSGRRRGSYRHRKMGPDHSDFLVKMEKFVMPIAFSLGILGSLVLVPVFTCTPLKASALSHYLAAIGVADFLFLIAYVPAWLSGQEYQFNNVIGVCQMTGFTLRLSRFMATWYLLAAHVERCLVHFGSRRARVWCSTFRTKCVILGIFVVSLVGFLHYIWTHVVIDYPDPRCVIMSESYEHILQLNKIEMVASVFLPMILILPMDVALILSLIARRKRASFFRGIKSNNNNSSRRSSSGSGNDHHNHQEERADGYVLASCQRSRTPSNRSGDSTPPREFDLSREKSCATLVVIISGLFFIVLWLPAHIYRVKMLFRSMTGFHPSPQQFWAMTFFDKLEKFNHIFNCYLYFLLLRGFRHGFLYLRFCCHRKRTACENSLQETEV